MREEDGNGDKVRMELGPARAEFRGKNVPNLLRFLIFLCLALLFALGYQFSVESKVEHAALKLALEKQTEAQTETTYVLTLSQQQREALNLIIPESLRKRIR